MGLDSQGRVWFSPNISNPFYFDGRRFKRLGSFPVTGSSCIVSDNRGGLWFCNDQGAVYHTETRTRLYNTTHGLAGPIVQTIYADSSGGVWMGTKNDGISYFRDGRWVTINRRQGLPGLNIRALLASPGGQIVAATFLNGIAVYRGKRWQRLPVGIVGNEIHAVGHAPDGSVWLGTSSGASRYHNGYWYNYANEFSTPDIRSFAFDPTGAVWLGTFGAGVYRFDGKQWNNYDLIAGLASNHVVGIHLTPEGFWFVHEQKGATLYDGESWKAFNDRNTNGLLDPSYPIQATHLDTQLMLHLGSKGGGVVRKPLRGRWQRVGQMVGSSSKGVVHAMTQDHEGHMWFATKGGVYQLKNNVLKQYTKRDGLPDNEAFAIAAEGEKIWIGTKKGVACFDGTSWRSFTKDMGLVSDHITVISISPTGEKWFGSPQDGLTIYRGE
jgi:ligand-binding sensor domain-containing protein